MSHYKGREGLKRTKKKLLGVIDAMDCYDGFTCVNICVIYRMSIIPQWTCSCDRWAAAHLNAESFPQGRERGKRVQLRIREQWPGLGGCGGLRGPHSLLTQDLPAQSWTWAGALQAWLTDWPTEASQVHSSSESLFARLKIVTKQINLISDFHWRFFFCFVVERRTHYLMFFLPDPFISMPLFYLKFLLPFFSHSISYVACYLSSVIFTARSSELFSKNNIW